MQKTLITIVPTLPPATDGLGDYAIRLAQQLYQDQGWKTQFIVGNPDWRGTAIGEFFQAAPVRKQTPEALAALLPPSSNLLILLHYVGHGYAKRGCPIWLVEALTDWCRSGGRLITMFHELYATEPLLSSAIVTTHTQKRLAVQLMQISDRTLTSRQDYANQIRRLSNQTPIAPLPIFSSIGEVSDPPLLSDRSRQIVVFGSAGVRQRAYSRSRRALETICQTLDIEAILDIGASIRSVPATVANVPVVHLGVQAAAEVSSYLKTAIAGFIDYPLAYLGKSSIFAAYCSHGVIPIAAAYRDRSQDGLVANQHYWLCNRKTDINLQQGQSIADAAFRWYQTHNLKTQAQIFADCLQASRQKAIVVDRIV